MRLDKPLTWDQFFKGFYARFFPVIAQKKMEEQFIRLQSAEFLRLSRFAQYMVEDEEKRANRFQEGLKIDSQMLLIPQQLKTYSQVLTIAQKVKQGLKKKNRNQMKNKAMKWPFQQIGRGGPVRIMGAPMTKRPFQPIPLQMARPPPICNYCQNLSHTQQNC